MGAKTTNAKAKAFQTPAAGPVDNDLGKTNQKNNSVRKAKPRISHAEMTKLDILGEGCEVVEPEIEYMPPRAKGNIPIKESVHTADPASDMPDLPDDHVELDFSMFENGGLMKGALAYYMTRKGEDGLSHVEREEKRQQKIWDRMDRISDAALQRDIDSEPIPCTHYPDCPGDLCKNTIQARKEAEDQYQKTVADIEAETAPVPKKSAPSSGPSTLKTKAATATVSQPKGSALALKPNSKPGIPSARSHLNCNLVSRHQKTALPTNPSPMRHTAATAASKTTMGYSKGRAASATLRKTVLPSEPTKTDENVVPDTELAPADYIQRYGVPKFGSEMWIRCKRSGCFDEDEGPSLEEVFGGDKAGGLDAYLREEAEQDFQLTF